MLRFYFPTVHKILSPGPRILEIWGQRFPPLPTKLGGHIPSIFCTGYPRDDPKNPANFVKVSPPVSEIFGIFHFCKVSYTLKMESLYSDECSFTTYHLAKKKFIWSWGTKSEYRFKLAISLHWGPVDAKFQVEELASTKHSFSQTMLNDLSHGMLTNDYKNSIKCSLSSNWVIFMNSVL